MIYLDNSATSFPKPDGVYRKMDETYRSIGANPGRSGHRMSLAASQAIEDARRLVAEFFGCPDYRRAVFTLNGTDAINIAVHGVLKRGDEIVTTVLEHNSVLRPLRLAARTKGVKIRVVEPRGETVRPADIAAAVTRRTKLVAVNHASNVTGWIQPVDEIGKAVKKKNTRALFLVDAAQTAGILPIDMTAMGIDLLAFAGHKALYGPTGTGGLVVAPGVEVEPTRVGGSGIESESEEQPRDMPYRLEAGTQNLAGIAGLAEGIRFVRETGLGNILRHDRELKDRMAAAFRGIRGLELYTSQETGTGLGVLGIRISGLSPDELGGILDQEFGIATRTGLQCSPLLHRFLGTFSGGGTVRFSFGWFNTDDDTGNTLDAVQRIAAGAA